MKILVFAHIEPTGGTGTFFYRLVDLLKKENHQLTLAIAKEHIRTIEISPSTIKVVPYIRLARAEYFFFRICRKLKIQNIYLFLRDSMLIRKWIKKTTPDLCIASQGGGIEYYPTLFTKIRLLMFTHSMVEEEKSILNLFLNKKSKKNKYAHNKTILFMSEYARDSFMGHSPFYTPRLLCQVVPNYGNDLQTTQDSNKNTIAVLSMGHMHGYKNPLLWFEVAKRITKEYNKVHFYWAGNGEYYAELKEKSREYQQIHLLGFVTPEQAYAHCDVFFHPSALETQGIVVVEALSLGVPCVVSNAGGLPESITDGFNGYICNVFDTDAYVEKLRILIEHSTLRETLGHNARTVYETKFSKTLWEEKVKSLLEG